MDKFAIIASMIEEQSAIPIYINPPRAKILKIASVLFIIGCLLITLTVNALLAIVTVPLIIYWSYFYYLFCKIWLSFRYSKFYLVVIPLIILVLSVFLQFLIHIIF